MLEYVGFWLSKAVAEFLVAIGVGLGIFVVAVLALAVIRYFD